MLMNWFKKGAKFTTLSPDWYVDLKVNSKAKNTYYLFQ